MSTLAERASPLAEPAARILVEREPTQSHLGGIPGLPLGVARPRGRGRPLEFIARVSLAELQRTLPVAWLPRSGALLFFYDIEDPAWGHEPDDREAWAVLLVPDDAEGIGRTPDDADDMSDESDDDIDLLPWAPIRFEAIRTYPTDGPDQLGLAGDEIDEYEALVAGPFGGGPRHQVGGHPWLLQSGDMRELCVLGLRAGTDDDPDGDGQRDDAVTLAELSEWRLLLQLDSDDEVALNWGDAGTLCFWVRESEAARGCFDNVWVVLQSG